MRGECWHCGASNHSTSEHIAPAWSPEVETRAAFYVGELRIRQLKEPANHLAAALAEINSLRKELEDVRRSKIA